MAVAKPLKNQAGKDEYSIKLKLAEDDAAVEHFKAIAEYKVDTKTNRALAGSGHVVINFTTNFPVGVVQDGELLTEGNVPHYDGRIDTGKAAVTYKVIDFGDNKIVRLSGVAIKSIVAGEREEGVEPMNVTVDMLKNL